jgi:hypothetical protein
VRLALPLVLSVFALAGCVSTPWSCADGVQDGVETGPDCGGGVCAACGLGLGCRVDGDCASGRCSDGSCRPGATCSDGVTDGDETDVDCGGSCAPCGPGRHCARATDCSGLLCAGGICGAAPTCADGRRDGDETDVDCGGSCPGCPAGAGCLLPRDCADGICSAHVCQATLCHDGMLDGDESDVDCGGGTCPQCMTGGACRVPTDCESSLCTAGHCGMIASTCSPGYAMTQDGCVCDPATCGSCCNVDEGNVCGLTFQPGANDCGASGQTCFRCAPGRESCQHAANAPDYCGLGCDLAPCAGCCAGALAQHRSFCRYGDDDDACGAGGATCKPCAPGEHCIANRCTKVGP